MIKFNNLSLYYTNGNCTFMEKSDIVVQKHRREEAKLFIKVKHCSYSLLHLLSQLLWLQHLNFITHC